MIRFRDLSLKYLPFLVFFLLLARFMILPGCAPVYRPPSAIPFSHPEIREIVDRISEGDNRVSTFVSIGRVAFRNWVWGPEAKTLILGQREPLQLKIELTHPWGQPILHMLIKESELAVLSFSENRLYKGRYAPETMFKYIPAYPDLDQLWSILRGYPKLKTYDRLIPQDPDQVILADRNGLELEKITLDLSTLEVSSVWSPEPDISVSYSEYVMENDIPYAGKIRVDTGTPGRHLNLSHDEMVFNRSLPAEVFNLRIPPGFEIIYLDHVSLDNPSGQVMDHEP